MDMIARRVPNQVSCARSTDDLAKPLDVISFQTRPKLCLTHVFDKKNAFFCAGLVIFVDILPLNLQTVRKAEMCPLSLASYLKKRAGLLGTAVLFYGLSPVPLVHCWR